MTVQGRTGTLRSAHPAGTLMYGSSCLGACLKTFSLGGLLDCIASPQYIPALNTLQGTQRTGLRRMRLTRQQGILYPSAQSASPAASVD